jgi:hypothetical protein
VKWCQKNSKAVIKIHVPEPRPRLGGSADTVTSAATVSDEAGQQMVNGISGKHKYTHFFHVLAIPTWQALLW